MFLDIAIVVVILAFGLMGLFQGVIIQLFRLGGLVAIYFYGRFGAEPAGEWLSVKMGLNPLAAYYVALIAGAALAYMVCVLTGLIVHRIVTGAGETPRKINRGLGGCLGLLRGALVAFIIAAALDMAAPAAAEKMPFLSRQIEGSLAVQWVQPMNPLVELGFIADVPKVMKIARSEPARQHLKQQPPVQRLENHPTVKVALDDPEVQQLIQDREWRALLSHPKIYPLFYDREIREMLNSPDMRQAIDESLKKTRTNPSGP